MVAMINDHLDGEDVFFYRPDQNVKGSARHPLRAARLQNGKKLTLEAGPVAIFAQGSYVGDALLKRLHPGETVFLPYALDRSTHIEKKQTQQTKPERLVAIADGVITAEDRERSITRYVVSTGDRTPKRIFIYHERTAGFLAIGLPPQTRPAADGYLIPLPIGPGRKSVLLVKEQRPVRRTITITADAEALGLYLEKAGQLPKALAAKLKSVVKTRRAIAGLERKIGRLRTRIADIASRSHELRKNLKAIEKTARATALRRALLERLTNAVKALDSATRNVTTFDLRRRQLSDGLRSTIKSLRLGQKKK